MSPAKHVLPKPNMLTMPPTKPSNMNLGKVQPVPKYPEFNPLDSDQEFSTSHNFGPPSKVEALATLKEVQSAHSTSLTESEK